MKVGLFLSVAACLLVQLTACDTNETKIEKTLFNTAAAKLSTIPAGYEAGDAVFSSDGHHVAVVLKKGGKVAMHIDASTGLPFDDVRDASFRPGTNSYSYIARKGDKECVVDNGKEGKMYDGVTSPQFASDGRVVYAAKNVDKWVVVVGANESKPFEADTDPKLFLSPDGKRFAHRSFNSIDKKIRLVVSSIDYKDVAAGKEYDSMSPIRGDLSKSHLVYSAGRDGKKTVVVFDFREPGCFEKSSVGYDDVLMFAISNDSNHLAALVKRGGKNLLVTDGKESPAPVLDMPLFFSISQNGSTVFSGVQKNKVVTFINGRDSGMYYDTVESISFSSAGSHYVFVGERGSKSRIVIDDQYGPEYDKIVNPRFSPDGTRVVYRARNNGKRFAVTADHQGKTLKAHPQYEAVWDVFFSPDGKNVGYGVKIGQELWWKVETL